MSDPKAIPENDIQGNYIFIKENPDRPVVDIFMVIGGDRRDALWIEYNAEQLRGLKQVIDEKLASIEARVKD